MISGLKYYSFINFLYVLFVFNAELQFEYEIGADKPNKCSVSGINANDKETWSWLMHCVWTKRVKMRAALPIPMWIVRNVTRFKNAEINEKRPSQRCFQMKFNKKKVCPFILHLMSSHSKQHSSVSFVLIDTTPTECCSSHIRKCENSHTHKQINTYTHIYRV